MKHKVLIVSGLAVLIALCAAALLLLQAFSVKIELQGTKDIQVNFGDNYQDPGAKASLESGFLPKNHQKLAVQTSGEVDTKKLGDYQVNYRANWFIFTTSATRTVHVVDKQAPELNLQGAAALTVKVGEKFTDPGYTAKDNVDGDVTKKTTVSGQVDVSKAGKYTLHYQVTDAAGNVATAERTVTVAPSNRKVIYLTFDDGPGPYTAKLLETLASRKVHATFFVTGYGDSSLIAREAREGHAVGIHTFTHNYKEIYASKAAYMADLQKISDLVEKQTGKKSKLLRFPGGSSNTVSSFTPGIMTELVRDLTQQGYAYFDWNVESGDAGRVKTAEEVFKQVTTAVARNNSSVVLQHDTKEFSVEAVGRIIDWGLANGYTFLPLDESSPGMHHPIFN